MGAAARLSFINRCRVDHKRLTVDTTGTTWSLTKDGSVEWKPGVPVVVLGITVEAPDGSNSLVSQRVAGGALETDLSGHVYRDAWVDGNNPTHVHLPSMLYMSHDDVYRVQILAMESGAAPGDDSVTVDVYYTTQTEMVDPSAIYTVRREHTLWGPVLMQTEALASAVSGAAYLAAEYPLEYDIVAISGSRAQSGVNIVYYYDGTVTAYLSEGVTGTSIIAPVESYGPGRYPLVGADGTFDQAKVYIEFGAGTAGIMTANWVYRVGVMAR